MTQIHLYDQSCVHIDGYKHIISFDTTRVLLQCKKHKLLVSGCSLRITSYQADELLIQGEIASINWVTEEVASHA